VERTNCCRRCGCIPDPSRTFCSGCGLIREPRALTSVRVSTDEDRGRALDDMRRQVEAGQKEFRRTLEADYERSVYEHFRGAV
jgi:hypothetical protein